MADPDIPDLDETHDDDSTGNSEAAKYRRRLRDTETERDQLRSLVERMNRSEVERLAGSTMISPGDLFSAGAQLADLVNDDGQVDPDKVTAAAEAAVAERPHWRVRTPPRSAKTHERLIPGSADPTRAGESAGRAFDKAFGPPK